MVKPFYEQVRPLPNKSFYLRRQESPHMTMPFHYHPELEITLNVGCSGKRFIGNSVERLDEVDLVLIGPNLPHCFKSEEEITSKKKVVESYSIVLQFKLNIFGPEFSKLPELNQLLALMEKSKRGIRFGKELKHEIAYKLNELTELSGLESLVAILQILNIMSRTTDYGLLSTKGFIKEYHAPDFHRLNAVYDYIVQHFREDISLAEVAGVAHMSETAFCRFLKKRTLKTFVQIVSEMRVSYACSLLKKDIYSVSTIAAEAGFKNLSNFNRTFKKITGHTPLAYSKQYVHA